MVIEKVIVNACTPQTIVIGRRTTYDTLQVVFDLSYLAGTYGSGTAVLVVKRSQDTTAYPATITQDGNTLTWTITEVDTYYVGAGECELMWYVNNGLAKTIIYPVVVMRDILQTTEDPPDAYENWVESLTELGAETQQNAQNAAQSATEAETAQGKAEDAQRAAEAAQDAAEEAATKAEEASAHAPIIVNGYWYSWDATAEAYQNTNVKAEGRDGTDGFSPVITVTDIPGGHMVTITDAGGTQTVDVMDGTDGTDGDDGFSPTVTITTITGGHRVTITDEAHPTGQSFDVMDGVIQSVNGKSAASITLDAGDIEYADSETYQSGSAGAALADLSRQLSDKQDAPSTAGTAGQVLSLDDQLQPVWADQTGGSSEDAAPVIINTASGDIASFADGADNRQIRKIVGTIVPVQAAGTPSPENPLPISGWPEANIYCGQNLIDSLSYFLDKTGITVDGNNAEGYTLTGLASKLRSIEIPIPDALVGKTIQITSTLAPKTNGNMRWTVIGFESTISLSDTIVSSGNVQRVKGTVAITKSGAKFKLDYSSGDKEASISNIMISGVSNGDYTPYGAATTLPINWESEAGTIYGGTVTLNKDGSADVVATLGRVDAANMTFTRFSTAYEDRDNNIYGPVLGIGAIFKNTIQPDHAPAYSNVAKAGSGATGKNFVISSAVFLSIYSPTPLTTGAEVLEYLSSIGFYIVGTLVTPQAYHFDNIGSLLTYYGQNNVWIDTGAITECDYPADTKLFLTARDEEITGNIAPIENGTTASQAYAQGAYFWHDTKFCKALTAIASGATFTLNTNYTITTVAAELLAAQN